MLLCCREVCRSKFEQRNSFVPKGARRMSEPSYDDIRAPVVKILEEKSKPMSSTTPAQPVKSETKPKP